MLLADRNPRLAWHQPPSPDEANPRPPILCVELDCPCGYHTTDPMRIMPVALPGIPATMPAEAPNRGWWVSLLNDYSPGDFHRVLPSVGCRWSGSITGGKVRKFDGADFKEKPDVKSQDVIDLANARVDARRRGETPPEKMIRSR